MKRVLTPAIAPAILGGFKRQARSQPAGLEGLGGLLGQLGGGSLLKNMLPMLLAGYMARQQGGGTHGAPGGGLRDALAVAEVISFDRTQAHVGGRALGWDHGPAAL
jgi:hypothetical protein